MERRKRFDMDDLVAVMARLRAPDGCPWDREQTHESLLTYLLEECYEYVGAVRDEQFQLPGQRVGPPVGDDVPTGRQRDRRCGDKGADADDRLWDAAGTAEQA